LLADRHEVFAMTRSKERARTISKRGAFPIIADALDSGSLLEEMQNVQPEVVIEMLTSLPKVYTSQAMQEADKQNTKLRREGGSFLQKAAQMTGARRYIIQSSCFWYAPGAGLATEETPFAFESTPGIAAGTKVYSEIEERVLTAKDIEGVSLRFGFFYGPQTWYAPDGNMADQVRQQSYYITGGGRGVWSFVHVEDAAEGIVAAMSSPPGIYNLTDDTPVELKEWLPAYAHRLGAPPPLERTIEEEYRDKGSDTIYYATQLRGASNAKANRVLGFTPRPLEWLNR
jgi:nucleoside-diphosphate-sugar epimerase